MNPSETGPITVAVSGAGGRMGRLVSAAVAAADGLELRAVYDPHHAGQSVEGLEVGADRSSVAGCDVVVEFTRPDVVMENLRGWHDLPVNAVVGTSGFDAAHVEEVRSFWKAGPPNCLIVPNFSIGAVTMMRLAEIAAAHFAAAEVIELHHDDKVDAPSGTAIATAERIAAVAEQHRAVESAELLPGARGSDVSGIPVHAVRLPGFVAHQEVIFGGVGETLTIRHDTTDRAAFMPGVLLAIDRVAGLGDPVSVGLEPLLGI